MRLLDVQGAREQLAQPEQDPDAAGNLTDTDMREYGKEMAAKLSEDASKLENISSTEGGMIRSSEATKTAGNVSSHAEENKKLAQTVRAATLLPRGGEHDTRAPISSTVPTRS